MSSALDNPVSLKKKGLTPDEFTELLVSKARGMEGVSEGQVRESIDRVIKHFCLVETNEGQLNLQRRSTEVYQNSGILADGGSSVSQQQEDSGGQFGENLKRGCHENQMSLVFNLQAQDNDIPMDAEGNVTDANGRILNCKELCNLIDGITQMKYVSQLNAFAWEQQYTTITSFYQEREKMLKIYEECKDIVMKRIALELAIGNDLTNEEEWEEWRKHVELIASFGFMLVILDSLASVNWGGSLIEG